MLKTLEKKCFLKRLFNISHCDKIKTKCKERYFHITPEKIFKIKNRKKRIASEFCKSLESRLKIEIYLLRHRSPWTSKTTTKSFFYFN